jgi:hypothetical protein
VQLRTIEIAGILTKCKIWIEVNLSLSYQAEFRLSDGIPAENCRKIAGIPAISMVRSGSVKLENMLIERPKCRLDFIIP